MNTRRRTRVNHAPAEFTAHCDRCARSFINDRALEQHTRHSSSHNICTGCDFDYITAEEMEQCDCNESEEEDESDEYYEYGSAGTLSDDGGGQSGGGPDGMNTLADYYSSAVSSAFSQTHYGVPGAWNGGTRTDEFTSIRNPWRRNEGSDAESSEFESASDSEVMYLEEDSDIPSIEEEEEEEGRNQDVGGGGTRAETPYCQRCNREFHTTNGLHHHCRMSAMHPWFCWPCRLDFDREVDMESHVASHHVATSHSSNRLQQQSPWQGTVEEMNIRLSQMLYGRGGNTTVSAGDASTSTIGPADLPMPRMPGAMPIPDSPPIRDPSERRLPRLLEELHRRPAPPPATTTVGPPGETVSSGGGTSGKPLLVVSCPLCLEDATALTSTLCGHVFCKECITAAIQHKPECPVCRAFAHVRSLHPIFLNVIAS